MSSWLHPKGETKTSEYPTVPSAQRRLPAYSGSPWENNLLCGARMKKKDKKGKAEGREVSKTGTSKSTEAWNFGVEKKQNVSLQGSLICSACAEPLSPGRGRRFTGVQGGGRQPSRGRLTS